MAFNSAPGRAEYTATAGQTIFPFTFKIYSTSDIKVYQTAAGATPNDTTDLLIETTDYTVVITGDSGGTLTLLTGASLNDAITIKRDLPVVRDVEYQESGDLLASTINMDQDYQTYLIADQSDQNTRHISLQESTQGVDAYLPEPNALDVIGWNSNANGLTNYTIGTSDTFINIRNEDSIADMLLLNPLIYSTVNVRGYYTKNDGGGGIFNYDATQSAVNNGGTIINGWVRQYVELQRAFFSNDTTWNSYLLSSATPNLSQIANSVGSLSGVSNEANFAQQGTVPAPIGWIRHHYTDGNMMQCDNVGTGNTMHVWKNALNATRRPDKPSNFVGDAVFLALLEHNLVGPSSHNMFNIDKDAKFTWTGDNPRVTSAQFNQEKVDDGFWGYRFELTNPHANSFYFDGMFNLGREATNTRTVIDCPLSAGVRRNSIGNQQFSISGTVIASLLTTGNFAFQGGGTLEYTSSSTGTVTQITSKTTSVTLNTPSGQITMNNASLGAGASVVFAMINSNIDLTDVVTLNVSGFAGYRLEVERVGSGSVFIRLTNITAGALADAVNVNFVVTKIS